jgi:hypothetical protein
LSLFRPNRAEYGDPANTNDSPREEYIVEIKTAKRFSLLIGCVALGASFRMDSRMVQLVRNEIGLGIYGGCSELIASNNTRVSCAIALQILFEALEQVSGFLIALDSSTLHGMSYLDVRIRFSFHDVMYNFHLLDLPLFDRHSGENMFDVLVQFSNALFPQWCDILVGSSTDGARSMTGRLRGLSTRLGQCSSAKLIRIWCGLHQLDLVMQRVFKNSLEEEFIEL